MQTVSNDFKNIIETKLSFSPKCKIIVDNVEYLGNVIKTAPKYSHSSSNPFGTFPAKTCSFDIYNFNNDIDFQDKEITIYKGIDINGTTEWVIQGIFIPRANEITNNITTRVMSFKDIKDRTQLLDSPYSSQLDWSNNQTYTGLEIVQEICTRRGLTLKSNSFAFASYDFKQPNFPSGISDREVLARLGQIGGEIVIFDNNGELEIKSQYTTGDIIPRKRYVKVSKEKIITFNTVVLGNEGMSNDIVYPSTIQTERIEYLILDNPFVDLYKEEMIQDVASHIIGKSYTPFTLENFVDGFYYELNDVVTIQDKNNNTFNAVFLDYSNVSRIKSNFKAEVMNQEQETKYNLAGSIKKTLNDVKLEVDHVNYEIRQVASRVQTVEINSEEQSEKTAQLETSVTQLQTDTYTKIEVNEKLVDGSVEKVDTKTGFVFDKTGFNIDKDGEPTKTNYSHAGQKTTDKSGATEKILSYNGYVTSEVAQEESALERYEGQSANYNSNIIFNEYLSSNNGRWEDVEDSTYGKGIGFFIY